MYLEFYFVPELPFHRRNDVHIHTLQHMHSLERFSSECIFFHREACS